METFDSDSAAAMSEDSTSSSIPSATSSQRQSPDILARSSSYTAPFEMVHPGNDEDDASDVSMSSETEDSEDDMDGGTLQIITPQTMAPEFATVNTPTDQSKKRKLSSDNSGATNDRSPETMNINSKRVKLELAPDLVLQSYRTADGQLPVDRSFLPAEIWHHVFTFTPPKALGRLLQVNKLFRTYLESSSSVNNFLLASLSKSSTPLRRPEAIWQASRRLFRPGLPSPLDGSTELDMWKLACGATCQFCGRTRDQPSQSPTDQWHYGPGENGVRPVWPFSSRSCGSCLKQKTMKEIDLLLSSSVPSPLMAALPFVLLTNEFHIVPPSALQHVQPPSDIQIGKYFFKPHIEEIKTEFFKVKAMGSGTAEEWLKGLDERGKERKNDAARWERWETSGGLQRMQVSEIAELEEVISKPAAPSSVIPAPQPTASTPVIPTGLSRIPVVTNDFAQQPETSFHQIATTHAPYAMNTPPRFDSPAQTGFSGFPQRQFQIGRQERTKEEVAELKSARKKEIERRCMLLDPPLEPGVLAHMASFQAAIQIIKPFDDNAWELLKPRLLSQRSEAEQRENDRIALRVIQERLDERQHQLLQAKDGKDGIDRDWEDAQLPLRGRIGAYADEVIRDGWNWGQKVTNDNSPTFAAEVLIYVRKRFYAEIAKDEAAARATGQLPKVDPPNGPFTQKLILENMKWVFDMKIKPHTEQYRKELFLCNGCENNFKFYGFEGVIQHYAAKHTSALSVGSIVVHWRAEWPEYPPFNPDPANANGNNGTYNAAAPNTSYVNTAPNLPVAFGRGGFPPVSAPLAGTSHVQHAPGYQESPVDYYPHPQQPEQYASNQPGSYMPTTTFPGPAQSFPAIQHHGPDVNGFQGYSAYTQHAPEGHIASTSPMVYDTTQSGHSFAPSTAHHSGQSQYSGPQVDTNIGPSMHPSALFNPQPTGIRHTEAYKSQLQDVARIAREIWNGTSGIKDMPGSVRVFVILYHIVQRFRDKYSDEPTLAMLIDGLSNHKDMRPVRNVNGLVCRACALEKANESLNPYAVSSRGASLQEKKSFSLPQLFNHFQTTHNGITQAVTWDGEGSPPEWDWTKDMIELPEKAKISSLATASGTDNHKIKLIMEALPDAFRASPTPVDQSPVEPLPNMNEEPQDHMILAPSRDNHDKFYSLSYEGSAIDPGTESHRQHPGRSRKYGEPIDDIETASDRHKLEERRTNYLSQPPVTYVDRREASPFSRVRPVEDYWQSDIAEENQFYSEYAAPSHNANEVDFRKRTSRGAGLFPADDQTRIERIYTREVSLPRLIQANARTVDVDPNFRDTGRYDGSASYRRERTPILQPAVDRPIGLQQPVPSDPMEGGSEDGELKPQPSPKPSSRNKAHSSDAHNAADRFFDDFERSQNIEMYVSKDAEIKRRNEDALRANWEPERVDNSRHIYAVSAQPYHEHRRHEFDQGYTTTTGVRSVAYEIAGSNNRIMPEQSQSHRHVIAYDYDDRPSHPYREQHQVQSYSSEVIDRGYDGAAMHGDDRHEVQIVHQQPSRFARYENVRLENDGRSRSPIYVNVTSQSTQYRERSPVPRYVQQQQPIYRTRSPQAQMDESAYERVPRPEYYRVYADEPRPRQPQYESQVEYVQMRDAQGDYVIRRPMRREEPSYVTYEEPLPRQAVYETRAPVSRSDPAYYEEYDPRNPAPPPQATVRQVRY